MCKVLKLGSFKEFEDGYYYEEDDWGEYDSEKDVYYWTDWRQ